MEYGRSIEELSRDELIELKQHYYDEKHPEGVSYGELAAIDELVSDEEIIEAYGGITFVAEDFFTSFVNAGLSATRMLGLPDIKIKSFYDLTQEEKDELNAEYEERNGEKLSAEELEAAYKDTTFLEDYLLQAARRRKEGAAK